MSPGVNDDEDHFLGTTPDLILYNNTGKLRAGRFISKMKIIIDNTKRLDRLREEFNEFFPFLTLEFFENQHSAKALELDGLTIGKYRKPQEAEVLTIFPEMSVADLEKILREHFGIPVQVLRKSGTVWLNTTHTDAWSLAQQNRQGEKVSAHLNKQNEDKRNK